MSKYAFMVSASRHYLPGLKALLNSIKEHGGDADVVIYVTPNLDKEHSGLDLDAHSLDREIIWSVSEGVNSKVEMVVDRFKEFAERGQEYDAVCLLDADMFLTADVNLFFNVASAGFIVAGSNGMIIDFNKSYQEVTGIDLGRQSWPYPYVHTTVPLFLSSQDLDWFRATHNMWKPDGVDDFLLLNIIGMRLFKYVRMICMPPYAFTGIHHWQIKPETAVFEKAGLLLSGTEEQVYMVHGQWWVKGWVDGLWDTMQRYFDAEDVSERGIARTKKAIDLLQSKFDHYYNGG